MTDAVINPFDLALGVRIRTRREERQLTQAQLADAAGVTFQQIQKYERGVNRVAAGRLALIAAALSCHPGELYSDAAEDADAGDAIAQLRRTHDGSDLAECFLTMGDDLRTSLMTVARAMAGPSAGDLVRMAEAA